MAKKPKQDEAPDEGAGGAETKQGGSKKKLILLAVVGLVALGGAGTGAYLFLAKRGTTETAEVKKPKPAVFLDLREMTVNLGNEPNQEWRRILKLKAALELHDPKTVEAIKPLMPRIEDALQMFLREVRPSELESSAATYYLREELLRRVNVAVHPAKVDGVLFREILIQ